MERGNRRQFRVTEDILATPQQRMLHFLLDYLAQIFLYVIGFMIAYDTATSNGNKDFISNYLKNDVLQYTVGVFISLFYYNVFEIFTARTFGKLVTQTIVVDEFGEKPHHETILIRSLCRQIPFEIISFLGPLARGWHDSLSKTYVVKKWELEESKRQFYNEKENA